MSAAAVSATSFGCPVDPLVGMTTAISSGTDSVEIGANASAGQSPERALYRASATCGIDHSGLTSSTGRR